MMRKIKRYLKNEDLKRDLEALEKEHPEGIYLSGALLMFAGSKSYYLYGASSNELEIFYQITICSIR